MKPLATVFAIVLGVFIGPGCDSNPTPHPERDARTPDVQGNVDGPGRGTDGDPVGENDGPDEDYANGADAAPACPGAGDASEHGGSDASDAGGGCGGAWAGGDAMDPASGATDAGPCPSAPESPDDQVESGRWRPGTRWSDRE